MNEEEIRDWMYEPCPMTKGHLYEEGPKCTCSKCLEGFLKAQLLELRQRYISEFEAEIKEIEKSLSDGGRMNPEHPLCVCSYGEYYDYSELGQALESTEVCLSMIRSLGPKEEKDGDE